MPTFGRENRCVDYNLLHRLFCNLGVLDKIAACHEEVIVRTRRGLHQIHPFVNVQSTCVR